MRPFRPLAVLRCLSLSALTGCVVPKDLGDNLTDAPTSPSASTVDTSDASTTDASTTDDVSSSSSGSGSSGGVTTGADATENGSPTSNGCDFVCEPDMGAPLPTCDPFAQACPRGQKCSFAASGPDSVGWDTATCVPVTGDGALGEACTIDGDFDSGQDDCALGHMCVAVNEGAPVCVAICGGSWDTPSCPPDTSMVINSSICVCLAD